MSIGFWIAGLLLGWNALEEGPQYLVGWLLILFLSILIHELGHALMARWFGYDPHILLYHMGGLAMYVPYRDYTRSRAILIAFAGPTIGLLFSIFFWWGLRFGLPLLAGKVPRETFFLIADILWQGYFLNFYWSLVNLLPVYPLDGGQISQEVCTYFSPHRGRELALQISLAVAAVIAVLMFRADHKFAAILFLMLGAQNLATLQNRRF